jgi:hypothetical protein
MILRIELNLPFLAPSEGMKPMKSKSEHGLPSSNHGTVDQRGKFYSFAGSEFDTYYTELVVLLTKLLMDEELIEFSSLSPFARIWQIKNFHILSLIRRMIDSPYQSLVAVGLRTCLMVIRLNPQNCVALVEKHILNSVMYCAAKVSFFGRVDVGENNTSNFGRSNNALENLSLDLFEELSLVLQLASICFSRQDCSIFAAFTFLLLSAWLPILPDHSVHKFLRCMNCESEYACFECISERYP